MSVLPRVLVFAALAFCAVGVTAAVLNRSPVLAFVPLVVAVAAVYRLRADRIAPSRTALAIGSGGLALIVWAMGDSVPRSDSLLAPLLVPSLTTDPVVSPGVVLGAVLATLASLVAALVAELVVMRVSDEPKNGRSRPEIGA